MQKPSNKKLLSIATRLLVLLLIAKVISLVVWWYLPSEGVELNAKKSYLAKYQRVDFRNMLIKAKVETPTTKVETTSALSIDSLVLKGLYGSQFNGYAIVAKKSALKKTKIVAVGEEYAGYKLKEIAIDHVIFTKNAKDFILELQKSKGKFNSSITRVNNSHEEDDAEISEKVVTRSDIKYYSKNPSKIWKDIAIFPVKKSGRIEGFKVTRIKKGSKMAQLGLRKGDIMIRANNVKLTSFNDALKLYKNINKIDTIEIIVLRNNEEKEIIYEIH